MNQKGKISRLRINQALFHWRMAIAIIIFHNVHIRLTGSFNEIISRRKKKETSFRIYHCEFILGGV